MSHTKDDTAGIPPGRGIFCNRTLNLRSIRAIGYDMDYTLIHYHVREWEQRAYDHTRRQFAKRGWPVGDLEFDPLSVIRGLTIDLELGNLVKANRFGYIIKAAHGTRDLDFDTLRNTYTRTVVDLAESRFKFLNTLFSLSEACLFLQLVDLLDAGKIPEVLGYADLYDEVRSTVDEAHLEGTLKSEIAADPDRFTVLDPETPLALFDQKLAGKRLLLVTNSGWDYTDPIMAYAFDRYLPAEMKWRDLFDLIIVSARKPSFFTSQNPLYEIVDEDRGLLEPRRRGFTGEGVYFGGNASLVETHLGLTGDEILYVGDHIFGDVVVSKATQRWRTALILRELEEELAALAEFEPKQMVLSELMAEKERLEHELCLLRLRAQRLRHGPAGRESPADSRRTLEREIGGLRASLAALDERIAPLAISSSQTGNPHWGLLTHSGNDKSLFARQLEQYADIYTSRVSNFVLRSPFAMFRSPRGMLPHNRS
jgi:5'-nucleotidase